jgi:hypothetical protein
MRRRRTQSEPTQPINRFASVVDADSLVAELFDTFFEQAVAVFLMRQQGERTDATRAVATVWGKSVSDSCDSIHGPERFFDRDDYYRRFTPNNVEHFTAAEVAAEKYAGGRVKRFA